MLLVKRLSILFCAPRLSGGVVFGLLRRRLFRLLADAFVLTPLGRRARFGLGFDFDWRRPSDQAA